VQHYFVAGWIPPAKAARNYEVLKRDDGLYAGYVRLPAGTLEPGASTTITVPLYAGPQEQSRLAAVAPGFDLVVDYGWLTIIAWPLFWLLEKYHLLSGNWGVAIILLTVHHQAGVLPALGGELQVDGEDEADHAAHDQDPRNVRRRPPEDESRR
jgi:YidC/Oxa1 family membrane protein insertase